MTITKVCRRCGKVTPFEELVKHKQCSHGVDALCKPCNRAGAKKWYDDNSERARETQKNYYEANKEEIKDYARNWQVENRPIYYARHARWRKKNREKLRDISRESRAAHPERNRIYRITRFSNPENREKKRIDTRNRRARKRNAPGKHTIHDIRHQLEHQNELCYWCSQPLSDAYHIDHVIPLIRGGSNNPENIVCTCSKCNCTKGGKLPYTEWQPSCPLFPDEHCS